MKLTQRYPSRRLAMERVEERRLLSADGVAGEPGDLIAIRLETADLSGAPVVQVDSGEEFVLNVYVQDTRGADATGIFSIYMDVTYDAALAKATADPQFFAPYGSGVSSDISTDGLIDEIGAFSIDPKPELTASDETLLSSIPMMAEASGVLTFATNPADDLPIHEVLLFDTPIPDALSLDDVLFGSTSLVIGEPEPQTDLVGFARALSADGIELWTTTSHAVGTSAEQLNMFEEGEHFLTIREALDDNGEITEEARAAGVTQINQWQWTDGSFSSGEVLTLEQISQQSGVAIPKGITPSIVPIDDITVLEGSPLHIPLDGYDPNGDRLSYTISVASPTSLEASIPEQNSRSLKFSVQSDGEIGDMVFQLYENRASRATERFIELAKQDFFDDIIFHRVIDQFMIQGGDPTGTGREGSELPDFDDQYHPDLHHNRSGILSMAKSADDTNNSQFFVTEVPTPWLDFNHTIFGQLVEGDRVRETISNVDTQDRDRPVTDVRMDSVTVVQSTDNAVMMLRAAESSGSTEVTVTATDPHGNATSQTFTVTFGEDTVSRPPYLADIPDQVFEQGKVAQFQLEAVTADGVSANYFVSSFAEADAVVNEDGLVTLDIPQDFVGEFQVRVGAGVGFNRDVQLVNIQVEPRDEPRLTALPDEYLVINDRSLEVGSELGVLANDSWTGADPVTASLVGSPSNGALTLNSDGSFTYTPNENFIGADSFSYLAVAGDNRSNAIVTINVEEAFVGENPLVSIMLQPTDKVGRPIDRIEQGQEFDLQILVEDISWLESDTQSSLGVFAAYTDIAYDIRQVSVTGSPQFGDVFVDGQNFDTTSPGLIDELGAFCISCEGTPQFETQLLVTIPMQANESGFTAFASDPADLLPAREILVFGSDQPIPQSRVHYGAAVLEIVNEGETGTPLANPDEYTLSSGATLQTDPTSGVLANDSFVGTAEVNVLRLPQNGVLDFMGDEFTYTPLPGFVGTDTFVYLIVADGEASLPAAVTLNVVPAAAELVRFRLNPTDENGDTIAGVKVGSTFNLQVFAEDVSPENRGVFSAYLDVNYSNENVEVAGPIEFAADFKDGQTANLDVEGVIDELGAICQSCDGTTGEQLIATIPMIATAPGRAQFSSDAADILPLHQVLLFRDAQPIVADDIFFDASSILVITNEPEIVIANPDSYTAIESTPLVVSGRNGLLSNDADVSSQSLFFPQLFTQPTNGTIIDLSIFGTFTYVPNPGFVGVEEFQYRLESVQSDAVSEPATVTIVVESSNVAPVASDDDIALFEDSSPINLTPLLLANDFDLDLDDTLTVISVDSSQTKGDLQLQDGKVRYASGDAFNLAADQTASDSFTYTISDGTIEAIATVNLLIAGRPDPVTVELVARETIEQQQVSFRFSEDVSSSLSGNTLTLFNTTDKSNYDTDSLSFAWDSESNTATWDFSSLSPTDGTYVVGLSASNIRNSIGDELDGNGDGIAGDDFEVSLSVQAEVVDALLGDLDDDGDVDFADFQLLSARFGSSGESAVNADLDEDGVVGFRDFLILAQNFHKQVNA